MSNHDYIELQNKIKELERAKNIKGNIGNKQAEILEVDKNSELAPYIKDNITIKHFYPFTLVSRIGDVYDFKNEYRHRKEFFEGEKIGDFVMPKNSNKSIFDLAKIYGFYESSNGINVAGKEFKLVNTNYENSNSFQYVEPILVGDKILFYNTNDKNIIRTVTVIDTVNIFNGTTTKNANGICTWNVTYKDGVIPDFKTTTGTTTEDEQPAYYKALYDTKSVIKKEILDYIDTLITTLPFWANGGGPIVPPITFAGDMIDAKTKLETNINKALEKEEKASY